MSGGTDTIQSNNVPEWAVPYAQSYLARAGQTADLPYQGYDGQTVAQLNPYQQAGYDAIAARAVGGSPVSDAASSEITRTLSGGYLGANPYLDSMVDRTAADIRRSADTAEARSAGYGNTGRAEVTDRAVADASAAIRGQDYARERGYMQSALGMAPTIAGQDYIDAGQLLGAGQGMQGQEQRNLTDQYQRFLEARDYPQQQLNTMGRGLGFNFGGSQQVPGANGWAQALGTGLAAYGAYNGGGSGK